MNKPITKLMTDSEVDAELARIRAKHAQTGPATIRLTENLRAERTTTVVKGQSLKLVTPEAEPDGISLDDFVAHMPTHTYVFIPTRDHWPATSVNSRIPDIEVNGKEIPASKWLDKNHPVAQVTWAPGLPTLIKDRVLDLADASGSK